MNSGFKVVRWGNSLAIRLQADLVRELNLKVGDKVTLEELMLTRVKLDARKFISVGRERMKASG